MAKKSMFDALRKKQQQIDAYYEKINELQQQQEALKNEFALKVGQLVLKSLNQDIDEVEIFSSWLATYLKEREATHDSTAPATEAGSTPESDLLP